MKRCGGVSRFARYFVQVETSLLLFLPARFFLLYGDLICAFHGRVIGKGEFSPVGSGICDQRKDLIIYMSLSSRVLLMIAAFAPRLVVVYVRGSNALN